MLRLLSALLFLSLPAQAAIFGQDDRYSPRMGLPSFALSRSTAVAVLSSNFEEDGPGQIRLATDSLSKLLCSKEHFANEPSLSYACSGFLVAPDLIVTAGHCMVNTGETRNNSKGYCEAFSWLFDYRNAPSDGKAQLRGISKERFYRCKQIIYAVKDERSPFRDYALVQLDRPVLDRPPLSLSASPQAVREPLSAIGYPLGMPVKVSPGAKVLLNNPENQSFITNLDVFDGNSGSPVFNRSQEVVGILVGGTPSQSFVEKSRDTCTLYNRCDDQGENCLLPDQNKSALPGFQRTGSEVQRIAPIAELLRSFRRNK